MKKVLIILSFTLLTSTFSYAAAPALSARDTTDIIVADNMQNQTLEENDRLDSPKLSVKKSMEGKDIKYVIITGTNAISTKEIRAIVDPYLKNEITKKAMESIKDDIQARYKKEGYPDAIVDVELAGSNLRIKINEGEVQSNN